jgi:predicted outer membrane repeat protein
VFFNADNDIIMDNVRFLDNISVQAGAAIGLQAGNPDPQGTYDFNHIWFEGNTAAMSGGALYSYYKIIDARMTNFVALNNRGTNGGFAYLISVSDDTSAHWTFTNGVIGRNVASGFGGAIYAQGAITPELNNLQIGWNVAGSGSGGVHDNTSGDFAVSYTNSAGNYQDRNCFEDGVETTTACFDVDQCEDGSGSTWTCEGGTPSDWGSMSGYSSSTGPTGVDGNISVEPYFASVSSEDSTEWDFRLQEISDLINGGDPALKDPDDSPSDIGPMGGPGAAGWDLDGDGAFAWWKPTDGSDGSSDGDCDDHDPTIYPYGGLECPVSESTLIVGETYGDGVGGDYEIAAIWIDSSALSGTYTFEAIDESGGGKAVNLKLDGTVVDTVSYDWLTTVGGTAGPYTFDFVDYLQLVVTYSVGSANLNSIPTYIFNDTETIVLP